MPNYRFLINFVAVGRRFWWRFSGNEQRDKEQKACANFHQIVRLAKRDTRRKVPAIVTANFRSFSAMRAVRAAAALHAAAAAAAVVPSALCLCAARWAARQSNRANRRVLQHNCRRHFTRSRNHDQHASVSRAVRPTTMSMKVLTRHCCLQFIATHAACRSASLHRRRFPVSKRANARADRHRHF